MSRRDASLARRKGAHYKQAPRPARSRRDGRSLTVRRTSFSQAGEVASLKKELERLTQLEAASQCLHSGSNTKRGL